MALETDPLKRRGLCEIASALLRRIVCGVPITLEIPREIVDALPVPPDRAEAEVRKELALALYARGALPTRQLCSWLVLTRGEGEELLAQRRVPRPYMADELADEMI